MPSADLPVSVPRVEVVAFLRLDGHTPHDIAVYHKHHKSKNNINNEISSATKVGCHRGAILNTL